MAQAVRGEEQAVLERLCGPAQRQDERLRHQYVQKLQNFKVDGTIDQVFCKKSFQTDLIVVYYVDRGMNEDPPSW